MMVLAKRNMLKKWTVFLCLSCFSLSILGTFLVRSGVLVSVHTFANDPERGMFILLILLLITGAGFYIYAKRDEQLTIKKQTLAIKTREGGIILNNLLMSLAAFIVLLGTLYPLFLQMAGGSLLTVGPAYFNMMVLPLFLVAALVMGGLPSANWNTPDFHHKSARSLIRGAVMISLLCLLAIIFSPTDWMGIVGACIGLWVVFATLVGSAIRQHVRAQAPMIIAHIGVGLTIIGIAISSSFSTEMLTTLAVDESETIRRNTLHLTSIEKIDGPNYTADQITVHINNTPFTSQKRHYPAADMTTTEAAIYTSIATAWLDHVFVTYAGVEETTGKAIVTIRHKPMMSLVWLGLGLSALAAFWSAMRRWQR